MRSLFPVLALSLATTASAQEISDFVVERETGSLWLETGDFESRRIVGEWRADGAFERLGEPFGPFTYRDPRVLTPAASTQAGYLFGRFGVTTHYRGVYRRDAGGEMKVESIFADPAALGCAETPATTPCHVVTLFTDGRGVPGLVTVDQDLQTVIRYWDGARYRAAAGVESHLDFAALMSTQLLWAPSGDAVVQPQTFVFGPTVQYPFITAEGRAQKSFTLDIAADVPASLKWSRAGSDVYVLARTYGSATTPQAKLAVYRLDQPFGDAPAVTLLAAKPIGGADNATVVDTDGTHLYYASGGLLRALEIATGKDEALLRCGSPTTSAAAIPRRVARDPGIWVACGTNVARLFGGRVTWRAETESPVRSSRVLNDDPAALDVVVATLGGAVQRFRADAAPATVYLSAVRGPGNGLTIAWEEATGPCGVQYTDIDAKRIICRVRGAWQAREGGMPPPAQVARWGAAFWAVTKDGAGEQARARLFELDAEGRAWTERASLPWPADATLSQPRLIVRDRLVAVDFGLEELQVYENGAFTPGFRHRRLPTNFQPGFDAEGVLYDVCGSDAGNVERRLCRIRRDGTSFEYPPPMSRYVYDGRYVPLARGGIFLDYGTPYVIRGERAIELGRLHGELMRLPGSNVSFTIRSAGDGAVTIQKRRYVGDDDEPLLDHYRYDGVTLTPVAFNPRRHRIVASSGSVVVGREGFDVNQAWQGLDGVWRAKASGSERGLRFGWSPEDAQFSTTAERPNEARAALVDGDDVLVATDAGLWSCPAASLAVVTAATQRLPTTAGCRLRQSWPFVSALARDGAGLVVLQGRRVLRLAHADDEQPVTLSERAEARDLSAGDGFVTWIEGGSVVRYQNGVRTRAELPGGGDARVAGGFVCAADGVYAPAKLEGMTRCAAIVARGEHAVATDGVRTYVCDAAACADAGALPKPFFDDTVFGTASGGSFAAVFGADLFLWTGSAWQAATPRYARGSLVLTRASRLENGLLSLWGGGVAALPGALGQELRHLRID